MAHISTIMGDQSQQGGFPGGMPGGMPFDIQAMQELFQNDPAFKEMAEKAASDPHLKQLTEQIQQNFQGIMGGMQQPGTVQDFDNPAMSGYADMMRKLFENPDFMKMAESLGQSMMEKDPMLKSLMEAAQNPEYKKQIETKMQEMREDPELKPIIEELETGGPQAMMKYMNDPKVMQKMGNLFGDPLQFQQAAISQAQGAEVVEDGIHGAASAGEANTLRKLVSKEGVNLEEKDEEGRTALHFAAGYGEHECMKVLLEAGAKIEEVDNNSNTALHYAAGYGQLEGCKILLGYKANVGATNADGKTPGQVAALNEQNEITEMLSKHSA